MKLKALVAAFATAFVMVACDSSTSSDDDTVVNSSDSQPASSSVKESSGKKTVEAPSGLTEEQASLLNIFEEAVKKSISKTTDSGNPGEVSDGGASNEEDCKSGETKTEYVLGEELGYTCWMDGMWIPTSGVAQLIEKLPPEILDPALEQTGLTKEEFIELLDVITKLDVTKNELGVTCEGEVESDAWKIHGTGTMSGVDYTLDGDVTFEGSTMTSVERMGMNMFTEAACNGFFASIDEDEEDEDDEEDEEIYGTVVESRVYCSGAVFTTEEKRVKENVTAAERESLYKEMVGECKDYRDGKISFEDLMMKE
jgi:hypothetical protein